jgi:ankyrin repeat protein
MNQKRREAEMLIAAAINKTSQSLSELLRDVKDINVADSDGVAALMAAALHGREQNVELLLANKANIHQANLQATGVWGGWTALSCAARNGHNRIVQRLLTAGAKIDWQSADGETALTLATFYGHQEVVKALLDAGANTSLRNQNDETAYDVAVKMGQLVIAQMLEGER